MPQATATRDEFRFSTPIAVRWGDMDTLGHVNNAVFFTYAESGRIAYRDAVFGGDDALSNPEVDTGMILAGIDCDFIAQVKHPATLDVCCRVSHIGRSSLRYQVAMFVQGSDAPAAISNATAVWFDYKAQSPVPVPDDVRAAINAYEGTEF